MRLVKKKASVEAVFYYQGLGRCDFIEDVSFCKSSRFVGLKSMSNGSVDLTLDGDFSTFTVRFDDRSEVFH